LERAAPLLLFGFRLWVAVCLALWIAFELELDNAYWAGASAAIVSQPRLGGSLRKGWFRMIGTVVGAVVIVVLTACFSQERLAFLLGLALWGAVCGFATSVLRNYAAYSAMLAGVTATIIASDELGLVGGASGQAFAFALTRGSEICIGIVCATGVHALISRGNAERELVRQLTVLGAEMLNGLLAAFVVPGPEPAKARALRHGLFARLLALEPTIEDAIGEASDLGRSQAVLAAIMGGLFSALSSWRTAALHFELRPDAERPRDIDLIRGCLRPAQMIGRDGFADSHRTGRALDAATRALAALPSRKFSTQLLADRTAEALIGLRRALDGLHLLSRGGPTPRQPRDSVRPLPDILPPLLNAARVFLTLGAIELFWITSAWPGGAEALVFAAIGVTRFGPQGDQAYAAATSFTVGIALAAILAAIWNFALLPGVSSFSGLAIALALILVPAGMLAAGSWQPKMFTALSAYFLPLLQPENRMSYDTEQFYNQALAVIVGIGVAALAFRLLPALPPAVLIRRLLRLTLRDLRRLTARPASWTPRAWEALIYSRLSSLPAEAGPEQRAKLLAALTVGVELIHLHHLVRRFPTIPAACALADASSAGGGPGIVARLACFDRTLAEIPETVPGQRGRLRVRARMLAISQAFERHGAYLTGAIPT
jgi:uncharacterized membrane protein YccC